MNDPTDQLDAPAIARLIAAAQSSNPLDLAGLLRYHAARLEARHEGPVDPSAFRFGGTDYPLKPVTHSLLTYLWDRRHRPAQVACVEEAVWGGGVPAHGVRNAVAEINRTFHRAGYPARVRRRAGLLTINFVAHS
jgi:hypothetical protein